MTSNSRHNGTLLQKVRLSELLSFCTSGVVLSLLSLRKLRNVGVRSDDYSLRLVLMAGRTREVALNRKYVIAVVVRTPLSASERIESELHNYDALADTSASL